MSAAPGPPYDWKAALRRARRGEQRAAASGLWTQASNGLAVVLQKTAHGRSAYMRWALAVLLGALWFGYAAWALLAPRVPEAALSEHSGLAWAADAICRVAKGETCGDGEMRFRISQGAWTLLGLLAIIFSFWKFVVGALARFALGLAPNHIVITGGDREAEALARGVVAVRGGRKRAAVLVRRQALQGEIDALGADGVFVIGGDPFNEKVLRAARVSAAQRVIAMSASVAENVAVAAAVDRAHARSLFSSGDDASALPPGKMSTRVERPALRLALPPHSRIRAADFLSLSDLAARSLVSSDMFLGEVHAAAGEHAHIALFGFDDTGLAVAAWSFRQFWFLGKGAPRVTVLLGPGEDAENKAEQARALFRENFPRAARETAEADAPWTADIEFVTFGGRGRTNPWSVLDEVVVARGAISAIVVSADNDHETLAAALLLVRSAPQDGPLPLVAVKEGEASALASALAGNGPRQGLISHRGIRFLPFGLGGGGDAAQVLDDFRRDGAARAVHRDYIATTVLHAQSDEAIKGLRRHLSHRALADAPGLKNVDDLLGALAKPPATARTAADKEWAVARDILRRGLFTPPASRPAQVEWNDLSETYIEANRAAADHATVKLLDMGWRPSKGSHPNAARGVPALERFDESHARLEHHRWVAERTLAGWRYGAQRNDFDFVSPQMVGFEKLSELDVEYDLENWRKAGLIAALAHREGFERADNGG